MSRLVNVPSRFGWPHENRGGFQFREPATADQQEQPRGGQVDDEVGRRIRRQPLGLGEQCLGAVGITGDRPELGQPREDGRAQVTRRVGG